MIARPLDRSGVCVCGLGVALHFDARGRRMTCDETKALVVEAFTVRPLPPRPATVLEFQPRAERAIAGARASAESR